MWVQVYLLPYRGAQPVLEWTEENSVKENGHQQVNEEKWRESSVAWPRWLRNNASPLIDLLHPVEVFLYLDEELGVGDKYDISFLINLLGHARKATWGTNIYIVVDKGDIQKELLEIQPIREEWFEILLEHGVTDIFEIAGDFSGQKLKIASALSRQRRKILYSLSSERQWQCYIFEPSLYKVDIHKRFIYAFVTNEVAPKGSNCVLALIRPLSPNHVEFINETLKSHPRRNYLVVAVGDIDEGGDRWYYELQIACRNKCELLTCRGLFELHYLLQKLNAPRGYLQLNWAELLAHTTTSDSNENTNFPGLLITYTFVADTDFDYCYAAAVEIHRVRESHPVLLGTKMLLYPAITTEVLPDILKILGERQNLIWLHIGHGEIASGIQESNSEIFKKPEDWLKCFAAYGGHLMMVSFSVCESEEAAFLFVQEPIGIAQKRPSASIGFGREVPIKASRFLTEKIIPIAIQTNGNQQAIMEAFEQGRKILEKEYKEALPILFTS